MLVRFHHSPIRGWARARWGWVVGGYQGDVGEEGSKEGRRPVCEAKRTASGGVGLSIEQGLKFGAPKALARARSSTDKTKDTPPFKHGPTVPYAVVTCHSRQRRQISIMAIAIATPAEASTEALFAGLCLVHVR